jgi:two-component system, NtrC family, sensor kinase
MPEERARILIVDDHEENRYVLSRLLERSGYETEQASTGRSALDRIQSWLPDITILDVQLPDMSGYEVCRKIKGDTRTAQVAVLQISASFLSNEDKAKALEVGADGYLTHPIDGVVLIATVRSLLRLRQAERAARESAEQWQSTFDSMPEGLAFVNPEGKLARMNNAFAEICGLSKTLDQDVPASKVLQRVLGTSEPLRHEGLERYVGDFEVGRRVLQVTIDSVGAENVRISRVIVITNVTDRRLAEYALRTAEKLAATGKLANAIAHEINNPLEALTNLVYLAQTVTQQASVASYLTMANEELQRIGRITKQTLAFHRDTLHAVPVDVGGLVGDVVALYQKSAAARQVEILCDRQPTLAINAFPGQLSQVFANLLRNATEAAPPNTQVNIRVRSAWRNNRQGARVTIHDRGPGITKEIQDRLFDPFFTTKELKGSGLGLWVSKTLVAKHKGTLRFRSTTANHGITGTTFEVFLPVGALEPGETEPSA